MNSVQIYNLIKVNLIKLKFILSKLLNKNLKTP